MGRASFRDLTAALLAGTFLSGQSFAVEPSGSVVKVSPTVNARGGIGDRILDIHGAVYMGDEIVASPDGIAQIRFVDDTRIVVGPNSRLVIDEFVFNPDRTARKVTIDAVKGAFRFISGNSPHEAYSIRTPTMTIGVRGTVVDINVRGPDSTAAFLAGSGPICDTSGACITAVADCTLHVVPTSGGFPSVSGTESQMRLAAFFPFVMNQAGLDPKFRADTSACNLPDGRFFGAPTESGSTKSSQSTPYR